MFLCSFVSTRFLMFDTVFLCSLLCFAFLLKVSKIISFDFICSFCRRSQAFNAFINGSQVSNSYSGHTINLKSGQLRLEMCGVNLLHTRKAQKLGTKAADAPDIISTKQYNML